MKNNFYKIDASEILNVPIQECNEKLVDLLDYPDIFVDTKREHSQKISPSVSLARETVAEKLLKVQSKLPKGIRLKIIEGYRPVSVQKKIFEEQLDFLKSKQPNWDKTRLYQEVALFVAPWDNVPPHSTGGAVDLTLVNEQGQELDMGTNLNNGYNKTCFTDAKIPPKAKLNREIMIKALEKEDFVNYPAEWWHWSYGDRYWAFAKHNPCSIYGSVLE